MHVLTAASSASRHRERGLYVYLLACSVLLPIDWFQPTGDLFREFGAKPASLLLVAGGTFGWLQWHSRMHRLPASTAHALLLLCGLAACGGFGAALNLSFQWSGEQYARPPAVQFVLQTALLLAACLSVTGNALLFDRQPVVKLLGQALPWAAALHLAVFAFEAMGLLDDSSGLLLLFRSDGGLIERPTGLTSEPSYFGTLAALYATALMAVRPLGHRRVVYTMLALLLALAALLISAKTIIAVLGAQVFALLAFSRTRGERWAGVALAMAAILAGMYFVATYAALDLEENLSSAMRIGSTTLAANAALDGYGWFGIGTGQFHFFYREVYAPEYLFASPEALNQFDRQAEGRASTFNLYVRLWLESGLPGLILAVTGALLLLRRSQQQQAGPAVMLFAGSLGFLLTQDTYFYPPLVLSAAVLLACPLTQVRPHLRLAQLNSHLLPVAMR